MDLAPGEEQVLLRDMVRRFLADRTDPGDIGRAPMSRGDWCELGSLGLFAFLLPERAGGMGGRPQDAMIVAEELGRALAITPLAESILGAADLVALYGSEAQLDRWIRPVLAGEMLLALAQGDVALQDGRLVGRCAHARWGAEADALVVTSATAVHIVRRDTENLAIHPVRLADGSLAATVDLAGCPGEEIALPEGALASTLASAQLGYVAELAGAMDLLLAQTLDHVRQRHQFGAPIATFQVVQHRLARMAIALEQARSMLLKAAVMERDDPDFGRGVLAAKAFVADAAQRLAEDAVQLHGGMGVTDELAVGRGLRRVTVLARLFGGVDAALTRLAA
jgi:alkylation response protein AidB-like acyl-CoA dehydrogenase